MGRVVREGGPVDFTVAPLRRAHVRAAADLLADCFFEDANVRAVHHPDPRWRGRALRHRFRAGLKDALSQGGPMVALDDTGQVAGVALWLPPGGYQLTAWRRGMQIRHTLGILLADPSSLGRQSRLTGARDAAHPPQAHWYLAALGVAAGARGHGVGSRLVAAGTARADGEATPCYLVTADERDLAFFRRAGFLVLRDDARFLDRGPVCWTMWREPAVATR